VCARVCVCARVFACMFVCVCVDEIVSNHMKGDTKGELLER
jgi:hypothetical protein